LNDLNLPSENVVMVGDDLDSDILGAHRMGMRGVLVKSGKFLPADLERTDIKPWKTINNISDLHRIFTLD
jgi:phospholysine phosphohistidine inorganic pyrophosphate phosphatase